MRNFVGKLSLLLIGAGIFGITRLNLSSSLSHLTNAFNLVPDKIYAPTREPTITAEIVESTVRPVTPVSTAGTIIIPSIEVNSPIVWDISVREEHAYRDALNRGVVHAKNTPRPGLAKGNTFLFAHSTNDPMYIQRYAAVFTHLNQVKIGDRVLVYAENRRYNYVIEGTEIVDGFNLEPLRRNPDYPMLTLQTCDPPGQLKNRLIVTARLVQSD
jgi:LPXTG-site transpeptidase (sortase) family protein